MSRLFLVRAIFNEARQTAFRSIGPVDPDDFIKFVNAHRDFGWVRASSLFPHQWKWYGAGAKKRPLGDFVSTPVSGLVLSEKACGLVNSRFNKESDLTMPIDIDGIRFYWISVPLAKPDINETPALFVSTDDFKTYCTEGFVNAWNGAGLTGCTFTKQT